MFSFLHMASFTMKIHCFQRNFSFSSSALVPVQLPSRMYGLALTFLYLLCPISSVLLWCILFSMYEMQSFIIIIIIFLGLWLVGFDLDWVLWGGLCCGLCFIMACCFVYVWWAQIGTFMQLLCFLDMFLSYYLMQSSLLLSSRTFSIQSNDQQFTFICRETHFWYILPDEVKSATLLNQYLDILSPCEKENVLRMHGDHLKKSALLARALVRTTIARCMSFLFPLKFLDFVLFYFIFLFIYFLH